MSLVKPVHFIRTGIHQGINYITIDRVYLGFNHRQELIPIRETVNTKLIGSKSHRGFCQRNLCTCLFAISYSTNMRIKNIKNCLFLRSKTAVIIISCKTRLITAGHYRIYKLLSKIIIIKRGIDWCGFYLNIIRNLILILIVFFSLDSLRGLTCFRSDDIGLRLNRLFGFESLFYNIRLFRLKDLFGLHYLFRLNYIFRFNGLFGFRNYFRLGNLNNFLSLLRLIFFD